MQALVFAQPQECHSSGSVQEAQKENLPQVKGLADSSFKESATNEMENNNVKFQTFLLIIGIFITIVGAAFGLLWTGISEVRNGMAIINERTIRTEERVSELIKRVDDEKKKSGGSSFDNLMKILGYKK